MDPLIFSGILGFAILALILLASAVWVGSRLGQTWERALIHRDLRSVEAFNLVSQALTTLNNRTVDEALGLVLKNTVQGLQARAGCVFLTLGGGQPLRLVYALGVTDFAGVLLAANASAFMEQLKGAPDNVITAYLSACPAWSPLQARGGQAFAATLFGRDQGWHGLLVLAWAMPEEATESLPTLLNIGRYAGQVLAELESREQRASDFLSLHTQLDAQELRLRQIDTVLHDAQSPLAQIPGLLFLLEEQGDDGQSLPRRVVAEIEGLVMLTAGILKTEISQRQLEAEAVPIAQLVELLPSLMSGAFANRLGTLNLRFEMDVAADLPPVWGERVSLIRVLNNLLNNAAKYNHPDGYIRLHIDRSDDFMVFEVENSGRPIPGAVLPHLFEFGYRVAGSDAVALGQGLGLYSCRKIIEQHGGKIWAEGRVNSNHFIFTVPIAGERRLAPNANPHQLHAG